MMDNRRILIANLAKGALGEDKTNLIGALLVSSFQLAAMSRIDVPEDARADFFLYADEFQNFANPTFAGILSEARKYRLALTLAHQFLDQLPDEVSRAVFGNVGSLVAFRVGVRDAERLAPEFGEEVVPTELTELPRHVAYAKLLEDEEERQAFRIKTPPPYTSGHLSRRDNLIAQSRRRYARPVEDVEARLARWFAGASSNVHHEPVHSRAYARRRAPRPSPVPPRAA